MGKVEKKQKFTLKKDVAIIDTRTESEFEEHHIPGAEHIPFHEIDSKINKDKKLRKKNIVLFVCKFGSTSRLAAWKAEQAGIKAANLIGGDMEWSKLNLPRIRSESCVIKFDLK